MVCIGAEFLRRFGCVFESCWFLVRSGGELLSHVLRRSTIAAAALNFRDRDGIGCFARAVATRPEKKHVPCLVVVKTGHQWGDLVCVFRRVLITRLSMVIVSGV